MFSQISNLNLVETFSGLSMSHGYVENRPSHVLCVKTQGESRYTFFDKTLFLKTGSVLFIPQDETYRVDALSEGRYCLINFEAEIPGARPQIFSPSDQTHLSRLCSRLARFRVLDTDTDRFSFYATFYELLAFLSKEDHAAYHPAARLSILDPAAEYLKQNLFNPDLKVGKLHTLCGISDSYFRRLFISRFGVPPKKYVLSHRLNHARSILLSGEYNTIVEVAQLSGFDDAMYFSKVYRTVYGSPPSYTTRDESIQ